MSEEEVFDDEEINYEVQFIVTNDLGVWEGMKFTLNSQEFENILTLSKKFWSGSGFELYCADGSVIIFPPEVVQKSILRVKKRVIEDGEVQE